ncbi:MAG: CoA pyrophosphatase [Clostridiales Family XIII bacterium]|nr:CoA pyrophosphatase [Clostridiales Family XIII bacterium]
MIERIEINALAEILSSKWHVKTGCEPYYSVVAPLVRRKGAFHLLYELRSDKLRRQPGEVSFPGGRLEDNESAEECAIREATEELGISRENIRILGKLDETDTYDGFALSCYLALLDDLDFENTFNADEVKEIFLTPLGFLLENEPTKVRCWYEYYYRNYLIWGLTARLTMKLIELIRCNF